MAVWDVTKPADTDLVRNFPSAHRIDKTSLRDQLQVEHDVLPPTGTPTGRHKFPSGNTAGRPADPATGSIYFNTQTGVIEQFDGAVWVARAGAAFPAGTILLFKQAAAPTGWTRQVDAGNTDAVIIQRTNGEAPGAGGAWVLSGGNVGSHVLTIAEMPSHSHTTPISPIQVQGEVGAVILGATGNTPTSLEGSGAGHVHPVSNDGTWRPKHVDCIVATKD